MAVKRKTFGTRLKELALIGAALIATLLACEILFRVIGVSYPVFVRADPVLGASQIPGAKGLYIREGRAWVEINSDGMRGPEVAVEKPPNTYRIALLGDSYVQAVQVPFDSTFGEVLERRLSALQHRPVEVLNFGVGGYGSTQELLTLQRKVWKYSPDLVLLAVTTGNDISDNYRPLKRIDYVPYHVFRGTSLVLDSSFTKSKEYLARNTWTSRLLLPLVQHSRVFQLLNDARYTVRIRRRKQEQNPADAAEPGMSDQVYLSPRPGSDWDEAWRVTEGVIHLIRNECRAKGTPLAMLTLTTGIQVNPDPAVRARELQRLGIKDFYYPDRRLAHFGAKEGIPVLNLAPAMLRQAEQRQVIFHGFEGHLGKGHWNERGHEAAGELIATWIAAGFPGSPSGDPKP
jgi:hypothetical protein